MLGPGGFSVHVGPSHGFVRRLAGPRGSLALGHLVRFLGISSPILGREARLPPTSHPSTRTSERLRPFNALVPPGCTGRPFVKQALAIFARFFSTCHCTTEPICHYWLQFIRSPFFLPALGNVAAFLQASQRVERKHFFYQPHWWDQ